MFEKFRQNFPVDSRMPADTGNFSLDTKVPGLSELLASSAALRSSTVCTG
ncbi:MULTISPECIES: hypothetical protein [unclassified Mesorhizobium]